MNASLVTTCFFIMLARSTDVSLDTLRTVAIVQGRRVFAALVGFVEALIYIVAIAKVLQNFIGSAHPVPYAIAYAAGFALGTFLGIMIDGRLAFGEQLVAILSHQGEQLVTILRGEGYQVTELNGRSRGGDVAVLYIEVPRRQVKALTIRALAADPECFYVIHDVRASSAARRLAHSPGQGSWAPELADRELPDCRQPAANRRSRARSPLAISSSK